MTNSAQLTEQAEALEAAIKEFGGKAFAMIKKNQRNKLSRQTISSKMMNFSMRHPETKANLFRLVDVLPSLNSSATISQHINEYLFESESSLPKWLKRLLKPTPKGITGFLAAQINKIAISQMAQIFIAGADAKTALPNLKNLLRNKFAFTVDLLGEYSLSEKEALIYQQRYIAAITSLKTNASKLAEIANKNPTYSAHRLAKNQLSISIKLSALYSQTSALNFQRSVAVLSDRLKEILSTAQGSAISVYLDAEDSANNPIILATFKNVFSAPEFIDFPYPGIVVQAYSKHSQAIITDLLNFAKTNQRPIAIRLVKGAYWDHETVMANQNHWKNPLFETKSSTDANFEYLSRILLDEIDFCLPAFASHNVRSLAHACCYAEQHGIDKSNFELQMLYGMADPIAKAFLELDYLVRLYVPLGETLPGMGYLVRRLLENTSNESFLKHTFFDEKEFTHLLSKPTFGVSNA